MSDTKGNNRGYFKGVLGDQPNITGSMAEHQGYDEGRKVYLANRTGSGGYSPAIERVLTIVGGVLALIGLVLAAPVGYVAAMQAGATQTLGFVCAAIAGMLGVGLGMIIPRIVMAILMLASIAFMFVVTLGVIGLVVLAARALVG